ncbi:TetR/AcrR family transcriptional regulator [Streptomyces litchfieldiae]|uniref:Helix-turn-helix domain-containing protein n=1 Tax=Streptomyces litchfieldiae TaxID=3075543 RepID=A0ABU2MIN5_9ACTN|nr:helix-turn-helix domain-containing protein [Streptomyces sp. DSM 44938]MDT0341465.1 helix-turn-helix domain-containing protein [Streptomyces sp. DSM 44938]
MRADAQRNAEKLRAAAVELFRERGLQVPLKEIARRAGVSHGTLYNLFGSREALIDEVVVDLAAHRLDRIAEQALARDDAWGGFAYYIEKVCELQAVDPAISDVVTRRFPGAERLMAVCDRSYAAAARVIERAQRAGVLRPDFTRGDLLFIFGTNALLARAAADAAPDAWRRGVAFMLDGLRAEAAHPLPAGPLTSRQVYEVMGRLAGAP